MTNQITIPQTGNMGLKPAVLERLNTAGHRIQLAMILGCTENTIRSYLSNNDVKLTQYTVLEYIKKIMGNLEVTEVLEPKKEIA